MIKFIFKAILRDKNRSLLPITVVATGVLLTIALSGYLSGMLGDIIDQNARFQTGHVKVMTRAYADNVDQMPNDLALLGLDEVHEELNNDFPDYTWELLYIGFIPGVLAMVIGTMLSGIGIYKRETATLFKELEV